MPPVALSEVLNDAFAMPGDKLVVLIASGPAAAAIERARVAVLVWAGEPASVTVTPILKLPLAVGVPETRPVDPRVSPAGRAPEVIDHVYGEVPPAACSAFEYDAAIVPEGKLDVETVSGAGAGAAMVIERFGCRVCGAGLPASLIVTVKVLVPVAVGVPEIRPVAEASLRPAGRLPLLTDQV